MRRFLVVISLYEPRDIVPLDTLARGLRAAPAGVQADIVVVINRTSTGALPLPPSLEGMTIVDRPNEGMNIGAWDHGWRMFPDYSGYLFLQDECELKSGPWLKPFVDASDKPSVGLVGESWNSGWDRPWETMRSAVDKQQMREHTIAGKPANRVDVYLQFMARHGVAPGHKAGHLRSLTWFASRATLLAMDGFLHGANFGECIAAEIAATKRSEQAGLLAVQVGSQPFLHFGHKEWHQDALGNWRHGPQAVPPIDTAHGWHALWTRMRGAVRRAVAP